MVRAGRGMGSALCHQHAVRLVMGRTIGWPAFRRSQARDERKPVHQPHARYKRVVPFRRSVGAKGTLDTGDSAENRRVISATRGQAPS
jgi:hypothetical protein